MKIRKGFNNPMKFFLVLVVVILTFSCEAQEPENWPQKKLDDWFEKQEWENGWKIKPHESIDKTRFAVSYFNNTERWQKVFSYLANTNLTDADCENIIIDEGSILIYIKPYMTRGRENVQFKSDKEYITLHYVIEGEELIGLADNKDVNELVPVIQDEDIALYDYNGGNYFKADQETFVVFFPGDIYCSGVKKADPDEVKKLIVKIKEKE